MRFLILLVFCSSLSLNAQMNEEKVILTTKERIGFGLDLNVQVEGNNTLLEFAPSAQWSFYKQLAIGIRMPYELYRQNIFTHKLNTHNLSARIYSKYIFIEELGKVLPVKSKASFFIQVEYEVLSVNSRYDTHRAMNDILIPGLGIAQKINKKSSFYIMLVFSFSQNPHLYYQNPIVRMGFTF